MVVLFSSNYLAGLSLLYNIISSRLSVFTLKDTLIIDRIVFPMSYIAFSSSNALYFTVRSAKIYICKK